MKMSYYYSPYVIGRTIESDFRPREKPLGQLLVLPSHHTPPTKSAGGNSYHKISRSSAVKFFGKNLINLRRKQAIDTWS